MAKLNFNFIKKLPDHEKKITLSTQLTLLRIGMVPFIIGAMIANSWLIALILFIIAAITDILDGLLARLLNEKTFLGACLDPIADKFLVLSSFIALGLINTPCCRLPVWFILPIIIKELILVGGSSIFYYFKGHIGIQPTILGKATTVIQMAFISWLLASYWAGTMFPLIYSTLLGLILVLVCITLLQYIRIGIKQLQLSS